MSIVRQCQVCGQPHPGGADGEVSIRCSCGALIEGHSGLPGAPAIPAPESAAPESSPLSVKPDPLREAHGAMAGWATLLVVPGFIFGVLAGVGLLGVMAVGQSHRTPPAWMVMTFLLLCSLAVGPVLVSVIALQLSHSARKYSLRGQPGDLTDTARNLVRFFRAAGLSAVVILILFGGMFLFARV